MKTNVHTCTRVLTLPPNMNKLIQAIPPGAVLPEHHPATGKGQKDSRATAYVCIGQTCSLPLVDPAELALTL